MADTVLSTAQRLAVAVLQGDILAARALCDHLMEEAEWQKGSGELVPVSYFKVEHRGEGYRLKALCYWKTEEAQAVDQDDLEAQTNPLILQWLRGEKAILHVSGIERIEVYEIPTPPERVIFVDHLDQAQLMELRSRINATLRRRRGSVREPSLGERQMLGLEERGEEP